MEQTFLAGLVIGLFVGWLIELLIDVFFWRRGNSAAGMTSKQLADANLSLATARQHINLLDVELSELTTQNRALNATLYDSRREIENLRAQLAMIAASRGENMREISSIYSRDSEKPSDTKLNDFIAAAAQTVDERDAFKRSADEAA